MAIELYDRVKETATTTGTGTFTLAGAVSGFRSFTSVLSNNDTCYYAIVHQSADEWETGIGTFTTSGTTLARTTILASTNSNNAVNFSSGTKDVFITVPASIAAGHMFSTLGYDEISITTTATATISRMHVCSGTTADYTVTLPAASGNAGKLIGFRMATGLTKLVTLDGNSTETIDGATTRIMWAGESCILLCDGSNWFKIAGKTIPTVQRATNITANSADQSISNTTMTLIALAVATDDPVGKVDLANDRIYIPRPSIYNVSGSVYYWGTFTVARVLSRIFKNGSELFGSENNTATSSSYANSRCEDAVSLAAGDYVDLRTYQDSGSSQSTHGLALNILTVTEVPQW